MQFFLVFHSTRRTHLFFYSGCSSLRWAAHCQWHARQDLLLGAGNSVTPIRGKFSVLLFKLNTERYTWVHIASPVPECFRVLVHTYSLFFSIRIQEFMFYRRCQLHLGNRHYWQRHLRNVLGPADLELQLADGLWSVHFSFSSDFKIQITLPTACASRTQTLESSDIP